MGDWGNAVLTEQLRKKPHHHLAVFQHVAHAAGHSQVVFQHIVFARASGIRRANNVNAADVRVNIARHVDVHHLGAELRVLKDLLRRHDAGLQNLLTVVHVVNKAIKGGDALHQAFFHRRPFVRRDDTGDQIKRDQALSARAVFVFCAVYSKGDSYPAENHFGLFTPGLHRCIGLALQPLAVQLVMCPHLIGGHVHFIKHWQHGLYLRQRVLHYLPRA